MYGWVCSSHRCYVVWAASGGLSLLWHPVSRPISPESSRPINGLCGWWLAAPCQLPPAPWKHCHLAPRYTCCHSHRQTKPIFSLKTSNRCVVCVCLHAEFRPGEPWKGYPNIDPETDPYVTPGSVINNLSINTVRDTDHLRDRNNGWSHTANFISVCFWPKIVS